MNDPLLSAFGDPLDVEEDTPLNQFGHPLDLVPEDPVEIPEADRGPARGITEEPLKLDPDRAARIHRAAEVTGMHPIVVRDNLEEVERRFRLQQINDLVVQDPALGRVMENPIAAGLAHGEAESLSLLGQTVRSFRNFGGAWASAIPAFSGGLWQLVRAGAEVTGLDGLAEYAKEGAESADYTARWLNPPNPNPILNTAYSGLQSAGQTLALTAGGTPRLVVAGLSALSAGHAYGQAREAGLDPLAAVIYGAGQGAIEGMTERLSASALVDLLKGTGTSLLSSLRRFAFGEALGEQLATLLQDFQEWVVLNPEKSAEEFGDERLPAALETLIATAVSVGASGTVAQGLSALRERREAADRAAQQRQLLDQLMKGSSASHLRAADPAAFQAYLDESSRQENGDPGVFYLDGRSFAQALSESGVQIDQLREQSPDLVQRLAEAIQTDGDVVVPMAEFVTLFADSPAADRLTMIVRESEHAMSAEEAAAFAQSGAAEQFNAVIDEALQKAARGEADVLERDLVRDQIREQVAQQLTALGRWTPEVVDTNASIAATLYARTARHMGLTPMEFIDRYVPQVESAAQPGASAVLQAARDEVGGTRERTDTPEFRNWFGDSKAVDENGEPLVVYHGTQHSFDSFDPEMQGDTVFSEDRGFFFTNDPAEASAYATLDWDRDAPLPNVMPVYLSLKNPKLVELLPEASPYERPALWYDAEGRDAVEQALAEGHDGLIVRDLREDVNDYVRGNPLALYVAFRPEQIKSVFNRGGWDPSNPDTLAQSARRSTSDVGHKRDKSGRYVGAPDWIGASPEKLKVLRRQLKKLALEGGASRYWYEDSARAVLELVNSDPVEAEKFIGLLAIYSQGTEVSANVTFALTAYYQWKNGLPIDTGRFPVEQSRKAEDVLRHDTGWGGVKTNNFYSDLMEEIDPAKVDGDHATMDMWLALAFDYGSKVLDQGPKYGFAKREITRLAAELGIRPHQAQAQVWAAIKYRVESTAAERNEIERRTGIQVKDKKGNWHVPKAQEKSHFRLATKLGMGMDANQADIDDAKYDFSDALRARTIQMSWGVSPEGLPGIHDAPMAQKLEYLSAIRAALADESGRDLIADMTGLPQGVAGEGVRARDGLTDVGVQTLVPVALEGTGKGRTLRSTSRDIVELSAAIRGYVLGQTSVSYHHPVPGDAKIRHNGVSLETVRPLTAEEVQLLQAALVGRFGPDGVSLDWSADRVTVLNQGDGKAVDNGPFQKAFRETVEALPDDFGGSMTLATFRAEGDSVTNDWQVNPNGESYLERITGRRPDLLGRVADLRARVEAVNAAFAARYGWDQPAPVGQSYSQSGRDGQSVRGPAAIGVSPASGVHFSSQRRTVLDGRYYGTGLRGAEAERIAAATDPRLRERVYVYIDEGGGVRPESGVGAYAHEVRLPTLYDMYTDPLKLNGILNTDINAWESAILDAGFHGYYSRTRPQAAAVVIGDASRAIQAVPIDAPPVPGLGPSVNVAPARYSAVLSSAEIDAIDMEAIRAVAPSANLRMGKFTVDAAEAGAARAKAAEKGVELPARSLYQEAGPPRGLYTPDTNTISLLEGADLSTFLHELGHFGLEMMMEIAARENAPQQVIDDVKTLLKWFGVADLQTWQGMTLEQKREYHEKFAEGFETYLFEGVAPALDLTGAFNRVRQWMSDVYRMLSSEMNVQLDDEVRAVFDRMLASEDQIAEQQRIREMMPSFESADQVGVEAWEEMQRLGEEASQTAINNLRARTLRDLRWFANAKSRQLKKLQKTSREIRAGLRADVSREVYNRPVYAAFRFIATGVAEDRDLTNAQRKAIDTVAGQKTQLSMPALRAFYGEQSPIPGMLDRKLVRNEGGADPDAVAVAFGFDSGDAMVRALLEAEPAEPLIDSIVDRRMLEEHADLSSPLDIERAAEAAIYNDARARLAATEVRAIAEGLNAAEATGGTVTVPETVIPETVDRHGRVRKAHTRKAYTRSLTVNGLVRAATQYADAIVGRSTPRQLTPLTHSRAATKAATLARQAQRDGDMATALQHHRNRLLHTKTAQRMEEARNEFGRIEAYLRRFQGPVNPKASIDVDYQEQIRNILQAIDTRANTNRRAQALESLREWISEQEAAGLPVALDEKLLNEAQATNIKDLTMDQLRGLVDQIRHVEHLGRLKKKLLTARDQREFEDIRDSIVDRVRRFGGVARPVPFNPSAPDGSAGRAIREYFAEHRKLSSLVRQMDGARTGATSGRP